MTADMRSGDQRYHATSISSSIAPAADIYEGDSLSAEVLDQDHRHVKETIDIGDITKPGYTVNSLRSEIINGLVLKVVLSLINNSMW